MSKTTKEKTSKLCFVISPIGQEGSEIRLRADQVLKHIITPVAKDCGYENVLRADRISSPGLITNDIVENLVEADLVIADLTDHNANVFYELALRHAIRKPVVQIIKQGEAIPFDVKTVRTISVNHHDLDSVAQCKELLAAQIHAVEEDPSLVDNPITMALDLQALRRSDKPLENMVAELADSVQNLRLDVQQLRTASAPLHQKREDGISPSLEFRIFPTGEEEENQAYYRYLAAGSGELQLNLLTAYDTLYREFNRPPTYTNLGNRVGLSPAYVRFQLRKMSAARRTAERPRWVTLVSQASPRLP